MEPVDNFEVEIETISQRIASKIIFFLCYPFIVAGFLAILLILTPMIAYGSFRRWLVKNRSLAKWNLSNA